MKKLLATLTTVAMLATSTVAFAGFDKEAGTYSVDTDLSAVEGQLTLLIIPEAAYLADAIEDADILYIDQGAYASDLFQSVGILGGTELKAGNYYAKIGGTGLNNIIVEKFTVAGEGGQGTPYTVGDTDGDGLITTADATKMFTFILNGSKFAKVDGTVLPKNVGDADGDQLITTADASLVYQEILTPGSITVEYTLPAGTTPDSTY